MNECKPVSVPKASFVFCKYKEDYRTKIYLQDSLTWAVKKDDEGSCVQHDGEYERD